jgi:hypothetical protein
LQPGGDGGLVLFPLGSLEQCLLRVGSDGRPNMLAVLRISEVIAPLRVMLRLIIDDRGTGALGGIPWRAGYDQWP